MAQPKIRELKPRFQREDDDGSEITRRPKALSTSLSLWHPKSDHSIINVPLTRRSTEVTLES